MKLKIKIGTVGYNNKILVSDGNFILGKNDEVNSLDAPAIKSHKTNSLETPAMKSTQTAVNSERTADLKQKMIISHEDEKVALVLSLTGIFTIWFIFRLKVSHQFNKKGLLKETFLYGAPAEVLITITLTTCQLV